MCCFGAVYCNCIITNSLYIDPVQFPQELIMMLNVKIQVAHSLKQEFQNIIDSNTDSFNQQMI
jgi:hypothetical protein